ncbi:polysaccharide biosynthesis tyrosine autokinase [Curtobacterium sp. DN_7.5]|uniref:polysaccharide biosynthesis tyrosine autokinase n=1 Tax=Curtobacterium sp. DN_7.5 TaxID=3049047 RepID=UPI001F587D48|nr:polysaccharide biosynthesis tyrosine autokinase [Curtobacterium sp. DN_7.5]
MNVAQFLQTLRRRWFSVALFLVLGATAGVASAAIQTPQYRATAGVFVAVNGSGNVSDLSQGNNFSAARVKSYTALAQTPRVLALAAKKAGLHGEAADLSGTVVATAQNDTVLISISATDPDPAVAATVANAVTEVLIEQVDHVERVGEGASELVRLSVFQPASPPGAPYEPRVTVAAALGIIAGLAIGIGQAFVRAALDTRLRSVEELAAMTDASVLAEIPLDETVGTTPAIMTDDDGYSVRAESFRQLRTHLMYTNIDGLSQSVVVTSTTPGEGKSSTALNLALVLARNGARVALVDADLRRPSIGTYLGLESRVGLSTVLTHQIELEDAMQELGTLPLHVLTSGRVPPNPSELLSSPQMTELIRDLERSYDHVIVDAPPLLPVTDPAVLGTICSGVLMVASLDGRVRRADVTAALTRLEQVGARVLGITVNRTSAAKGGKYYYNYEPTTPASESPRRVSRARGDAGSARDSASAPSDVVVQRTRTGSDGRRPASHQGTGRSRRASRAAEPPGPRRGRSTAHRIND